MYVTYELSKYSNLEFVVFDKSLTALKNWLNTSLHLFGLPLTWKIPLVKHQINFPTSAHFAWSSEYITNWSLAQMTY